MSHSSVCKSHGGTSMMCFLNQVRAWHCFIVFTQCWLLPPSIIIKLMCLFWLYSTLKYLSKQASYHICTAFLFRKYLLKSNPRKYNLPIHKFNIVLQRFFLKIHKLLIHFHYVLWHFLCVLCHYSQITQHCFGSFGLHC